MGFKSVMKKIGKVAAFAAPIVAAPFTGGASLAAIGALSGAAGAKLNGGGVKSMLLGAGLGSIPGLGKAGKLGSVGSKMFGGATAAAPSSVSSSIANPTLEEIASGAAFEGGNEMASSATSGLLGKLGSAIKNNPKLALGAMSLLGSFGSDTQKSRNTTNKPFTGFANANDAQNRALQAIHRSGQAFFERPNRTMSALLPAPAAPVDLPGLGVRIGGGSVHNAAMDPMTVDREYLQKYDPMQSVGGVEEFRPKTPSRKV